ncbi:hypothetical protein GLOIN_2v1497389 [Rhizophagus irregularis DAOM 181602=DAOM 197198]|uniref:Uncharacterized protein n=1 Tax=Rhizophagus irregularis (strain DAOM 181602 / DAOM 197198 / MUCL 43194) TaxID=747089 RepID=A0A2P4QXH3_RHIID|nr:hypothetical protein GLOIN_2v1497389 [Rhizophagus irregularis DAOM 181602=DAOM 197198]POG82312.1 hypothetical protein GLOIN_2v1497389 [Rhizophagus irregularis DAOM 181602=DAOM 197198]|eukprot:XP_025189178.1 hypothetical protein GLOIN_2v1497389 [Rhizophagus irregularis DAOM 181602=DAOM 197198]
MVDSYNCLRLNNKRVFQVEVYKDKDRQKFFEFGNKQIPFVNFKVGQLARLISVQEKFEVSKLWKVDVDKSKLNPGSTDDDIKELGGVSMEFEHKFERYFKADCELMDNIHIVAVVETTTTELGRKRRNTEVETTSRKRREWAVNSTINNEVRGSVYFVDPTEASGPLFNMIKKGVFVALYGARASGKSTRVDQAMIELESEGYVCIYISFEGVNMDTKDIFWSSIGTKLAINAPKYFKLNEVKSADDFMLKFRKNDWKSDVVLFIDECDTLFEANDGIRSSFLGAIRNIKNSKRNYAIWSSVAIGPLSILFLRSDKINVSPFNVNEPFRNPNFTLAQVESLYKDYEDDDKLTIVPEVPRESVYDTELIRILVNWIVKDNNFEVNGQCHLIDHAGNDEKDKHYFSDIIIVTSKQKVVLELLASATKNELNEHFERVLHYAEMLSASDIWIVNFSCEDDAAKKPHWPPNDGNFESVNVAHFFHDQKFENVRMSARYISSPGTFSYITDQVIQLQ